MHAAQASCTVLCHPSCIIDQRHSYSKAFRKLRQAIHVHGCVICRRSSLWCNYYSSRSSIVNFGSISKSFAGGVHWSLNSLECTFNCFHCEFWVHIMFVGFIYSLGSNIWYCLHWLFWFCTLLEIWRHIPLLIKWNGFSLQIHQNVLTHTYFLLAFVLFNTT